MICLKHRRELTDLWRRQGGTSYEHQAKEFGLQSIDKKGCVYKGQEQGREEREGKKQRQTAKP